MAHRTDFEDEDTERWLGKLTNVLERDPQAHAEGRARFLAQAKQMAQAVSREEEARHTRRNTKNFLERILKPMKLQTKLSALAAVVVVIVVAVLVAGNVTTVSAQQILDRAAQAQSAPAPSQGVWHTRIQSFNNHPAVVQDSTGTTTISDDYLDLTTGANRRVTTDSAGKILEASSFDGTYSYELNQASANALTVVRTPIDADTRQKIDASQVASYYDPSANAKAMFEDFRSNPRVRVEARKPWSDGRMVYILVNDNYQSQKGTDTPTFTGSMRMVFDAKTYALVESQTSIRKAGKDVVIDEYQWLTDEALPVGSPVAWDLSDLKDVKIVDAAKSEPANTQDNVTFGPLTQAELAAHTRDFYVLKHIPAGYTQEIFAVSNQPKDQPFTFEIHYKNPDGSSFNMQAVGQMDPGFVESSFTDGSYKAASGLVLHYGQSSRVAGMLVAPNGESFLLDSTLSREQVQALVEDLAQGQ